MTRPGIWMLLQCSLLLDLAGAHVHAAAAEQSRWQPTATVRGIDVEAKPTPSGFHATRGHATVCAGLEDLERYMSDPARFPEWIPYAEEARLLEQSADVQVYYYMRTATPWPMKSRDMIYRVEREADGPAVRFSLTGVPDYLPPERGAVRMRAADGIWILEPRDERIQVRLQLQMDPGSVPQRFANQRMVATVGGALANLAETFPCPAAAPGDP